jgi:type III restriction enzyme
MPVWYTSKPCNITEKSHISHCVYDSGWEASEAFRLEKNPRVKAWAKNDHLNFRITYIFEGIVHIYYPDFLIKLDNDTILVLETKGQDSPRVQAKYKALECWIKAVNSLTNASTFENFGTWHCGISFNIADIDGIIEKCL